MHLYNPNLIHVIHYYLVHPRETCTDCNVFKILLQGSFRVRASETILLLYSVNFIGYLFHRAFNLKFCSLLSVQSMMNLLPTFRTLLHHMLLVDSYVLQTVISQCVLRSCGNLMGREVFHILHCYCGIISLLVLKKVTVLQYLRKDSNLTCFCNPMTSLK